MTDKQYIQIDENNKHRSVKRCSPYCKSIICERMTTTQEYIESVTEVFIDLMSYSDGGDEFMELITIGMDRVERMKHLRAVCNGCGKGVDGPAECYEKDNTVTYWCKDCLIPMSERRESE